MSSSWVGKTLGKVQIESLLGRGGVAEVYLGTHTTLDRKVAVKLLRNLDEENPSTLERFKREARAVAKLRHPNIVQVHDFDSVDGSPYLVMEYIDGPSLSKYLQVLHEDHRRIPLQQGVRLICAMASALQYAHTNRVIHRDVKPGNILLTAPSQPIKLGKPLPEDFEPVLTDFGLVRFLDTSRQTTTGHIAGTPAYMSPEQSRGEATDGRADVYSLGIVLYEMLAGDVPFDGESTVSILLKQVTESPTPIPGLSPSLQSVLDRALAKNVKDRFQTPLEFANALSAAVEMKYEAATIQFTEVPGTLPPPLPEPVEQVEEPAKPQMRWLRLAVPLMIAVAFGGFLLSRGFSAAGEATPTLPPATHTLLPATHTIIPDTPTSIPPPALPAGPIAILHFQNGNATADQVSLIARAMPAPPAGSQYQIWLTGGDQRASLGILIPNESGQGELTFTDPEGANTVSRYDTVEITIEPASDTDPEPSGLLAYSYTLPEEGLLHVRYLLSSFPKTPGKIGLVQGLYADVKQLAQLIEEMQKAFEGGDQEAVQQKAETALNLLAGSQSTDFKDWNSDGQTEPRESYGLLVNGSNFGYIRAIHAEAEYIISTAGMTQYMTMNAEVVKTCAQNMDLWTPDLRILLLDIIDPASADSGISESIRAALALTDQLLNGTDLDNNGTVDALAGECGTETIYAYAYDMADMPILPVSISYQLTAIADGTLFPATPTKLDANPENPSVAATPKPKPTQRPRPTRKPPPKTKEPKK